MKGGRLAAVLLLTGVLIFLSGCSWPGIDELYQLPQQSENFLRLQEKIDEILDDGAEYSAPISGENRSSVQLQDIDGDGVKEAVAFFKDTSAAKPLRVYIFQKTGDTYETAAVIESDGTDIGSILYTDFDGDGVNEMVVCWKISSDIQVLSVYSAVDFEIIQIMASDFSEYTVHDITDDGLDELIVIRNGDGRFFADVYGTVRGDFTSPVQAVLSGGIEEIRKVTAGRTANTPAVFIESMTKDADIVTDILVLKDDSLLNISVDDSGVSTSTLRSYEAYATDIDGDGNIDVPAPQLIGESEETSYYILNWYGYDTGGGRSKTMTTYHNNADGWYLIIPDSWSESLRIRRVDEMSGERAVIFSAVQGSETVDFLAIYALSGDNKSDRAELGDRFVIFSADDTTYAAEILSQRSDGYTEDMVRESFRRIISAWDA